ncbi:SGNH/GDSL hydrolase family protein [Oxalobacteraceae bacterium A2-2]
MSKTIKYIGSQDGWPEISITGKQSVWRIGQQEARGDSEADTLLLTGLFSLLSQTPQYPATALPGAPRLITIPEGQALTITGAAGASGTAALQGSSQTWAIGAGTLPQIGPYSGTRQVLITCSAGSIDATVGDAVLAVQDNGDRTAFVVGDSLANFSYSEVVAGALTTKFISSNGAVGIAMRQMGQRLKIIGRAAKGGSGAIVTGGTPFADQITAAIASGARNLIIGSLGVNDIGPGNTGAAVFAAMKVQVQRARDAKMRVFWFDIATVQSGGTWYSATTNGEIQQLNSLIKGYCDSTPNCYFIRCGSSITDPVSTTGNFRGNAVIPDGGALHPTNYSAYFGGKQAGIDMAAIVPPVDILLKSAIDQVGYSSKSRNILDNGLMLASSGGLATGFTSNPGGGLNATPSIVARADGYGNNQRFTYSSTTGGSHNFQITGIQSRIADGDIVVFQFEATLTNPVGIRNVRAEVYLNGVTAQMQAFDNFIDASNDTAYPEGWTWTFQTPPLTYNAATMGALGASTATVYTSTTGGTVSGTLDVGRMSIVKQ